MEILFTLRFWFSGSEVGLEILHSASSQERESCWSRKHQEERYIERHWLERHVSIEQGLLHVLKNLDASPMYPLSMILQPINDWLGVHKPRQMDTLQESNRGTIFFSSFLWFQVLSSIFQVWSWTLGQLETGALSCSVLGRKLNKWW